MAAPARKHNVATWGGHGWPPLQLSVKASTETEAEIIKAVLFDFGDTLASLVPAKEELFISAARSIGVELTFSAVQRAYQIVDFHNKYSSVHVKDRADFYREYNEQLCWALGIRSHFEELQPVLATSFKENKSWQLVDGVPEVLEALKQREIPLAIVANWDRDLPALAERLRIRHFFSSIISSQEVGVEKPDPAIFARAVQESRSFNRTGHNSLCGKRI